MAQLLEEWVASGRLVDLMLACVALEVLVLGVLHRRGLLRPALRPLLLGIGAGALLMAALRLALTDGHWVALVIAVSLALVCHLSELAVRLSDGSADAKR